MNLILPVTPRSRRAPRRAVALAAALALAPAAAALVPAPAAAQAGVVKLATLVPEGSVWDKALREMGAQWSASTQGRVTLRVYPGGVAGDEPDVVRKMRFGQLQAAALTAVGLGEIDKSVTALQLMPMTFRSWEEVDYVLEKMAPRLDKDFADKGFVVLFWTYAGWVKFFSKQPGLYPEDYKKMKIFAWAGGVEEQNLMKSLGYNPVPLEPTDILPGLQTGLITAVPAPVVFANAAQYYNQAPYMLDLNWAPIVGGAVITKKTWDKFPPATQQALRKAATDAGQKIKTRSRQESDEAVEAMKKRGLKVQPVSPEVEAVWRQVAESVYPSIRGKMVPAGEFDEVHRLLKEFRARPKPAP